MSKIYSFSLIANAILILYANISSYGQGLELTLPIGHTDIIRAIQYSPDGELIATGSSDNTIKLWKAKTGELLLTLNGHVGPINSLLFTRDGAQLLSTSNDKTARLWNAKTGECIYILVGHKGYVNSGWFSPDEKTILTSGNDATAIQWDKLTGERLYTLRSQQGEIHEALWSADGQYLFTTGGYWFYSVHCWKLPRITLIKDLSLSGGQLTSSLDNQSLIILNDRQVTWISVPNLTKIRGIGFNVNNFYDHNDKTGLIAYMGDNKKINIYDLNSGDLIREIRTDSIQVVDLLFHPDGKSILVASLLTLDQEPWYKSRIDIYNTGTGEHLGTYISANMIFEEFAFNPKSLELAVSPAGKSFAYVLDVKNKRIKHSLTGTAERITTADFSESTNTFLTVTSDSISKIWDYINGKISCILKSKEGAISSAFFNPSGTTLMTTDLSNSIKLWNLDNLTLNKRFTDPNYYDYYFARFCPDNKNIFALTTGENAIIWNIENELYHSEIGRFSNNMLRSNQLFSPDGNYLLNCTGYAVKIISIKDCQVIKMLGGLHHGDVTSAVYSPDGNWIATGSEDKTVMLWNANNYSFYKNLYDHSKEIIAVQFSPQSNLLITTSMDNTAKVWDVRTGFLKFTLEGSTIWNTFPSFTPDQRFIYASDNNNRIKVWETGKGRLVHVFTGHTDNIVWLYFEKDRDLLISAGYDSKIQFWDLTSHEHAGTLVSFDSTDWVFVAPSGRFDGSQRAIQKLYFTRGNEVLPLELFFEKYYLPGIYSDIISGSARIEDLISGNIATLAPPPKIRLINPMNGFLSEEDEIAIDFLVDGQGTSIDEIRIYQNNKLISEQRKGVELANSQIHYNLKLIPDTNIIRIIAINRERTESIPLETIIVYQAPKPKIDLYLLAVGINEYSNPRYDLAFAQNDAEEFIQGMQNIAANIFDNIYITSLFNSSVTRENINKSFKDIRIQAKEIDVFIFYYSGHGVMNEPGDTVVEDFYFVLHDVERMYGANHHLAERGISAQELKELCKNVKAQKQLIIVDACQTGGLLEAFALNRGSSEEKALYQLARTAGIFILASSSKEQTAKEISDIRHGLFTYTLLEGLRCNQQLITNEGLIFIKPLELFIDRKMVEYTKKFNTSPQRPMSWTFKNDFPIGTCR